MNRLKTIVVDDEFITMELFCRQMHNNSEIEIVETFECAEDALDFAKNHVIDVAVLDVEMPGMSGIELGKRLIELYPEILLIYITGYEKYAIDAFRLHSAAYILKPYKMEEVEFAIKRASILAQHRRKHIFIRTFGHFDVFINGEPLVFKSAKAKELLALLVDREGGCVNSEQVISILWEDRPNDEATQNLCSKVSKKLAQELADAGIEDIFSARRGIRHVNKGTFECDLYSMLENGEDGEYYGEYMADYSWAEERNAMLYERFSPYFH